MKRVRPRIKRGVMSPRALVDVLRVRRQFIVETIEVEPLTAGDQALFVRAVEVEMPRPVVVDHVLPMTEAGQRRVHHHPAGDAAAVLRREGVTDHVADIVRDQRDRGRDPELVKDRGDILAGFAAGDAGSPAAHA